MKERMRSFDHANIRDDFTSKGIFRLDLQDTGFANQADWDDAIPLHTIDTRPDASARRLAAEESCSIA
jgi:hypothetical protein